MKFAPNFHDLAVDGALIASLRQSFLSAVQEGKVTCHPEDLERIKSDEFEVKKYLAVQSHDHPKRWAKGGQEVLNAALEQMISIYKWRQENKVNEIYAAGPQALAAELFSPPVFCGSGPDSDGQLYVVFPMDVQASIPAAEVIYKNFLIWYFESVVRSAVERKQMIVLVGDHRRATLSNYSHLKESNVQAVVMDHLLPCHIAASLIVGASMMLKPAISAMVALVKSGVTREMSYEKIEDVQQLFGDKSRLADLLGGSLPAVVQVPGAKSIRDHVPASKDVDSYVESRQKVSDKLGSQLVTLSSGTTNDYLKHFFG